MFIKDEWKYSSNRSSYWGLFFRIKNMPMEKMLSTPQELCTCFMFCCVLLWVLIGSESTLAQVMACCLTAPSHYLNQCWLIISEALWHSPVDHFTGNAQDILDTRLKITNLRLQTHLPGANELTLKKLLNTFLESTRLIYVILAQ